MLKLLVQLSQSYGGTFNTCVLHWRYACGFALVQKRKPMSERGNEALSQGLSQIKNDPQLAPLQVRIQEAARLLGYDERTIRRFVDLGELPTIGRGRLRRIALADLRAWQDRNRR